MKEPPFPRVDYSADPQEVIRQVRATEAARRRWFAWLIDETMRKARQAEHVIR